MTPNISAILTECIERGVAAGLRRHDAENILLQQDIENCIWLEIDSLFTFNNGDT